MRSLWLKVMVLFVIFLVPNVRSLKCYTCTYLSSYSDQTCLLEPDRVTDCDKKYCTIVRQELLKPHGKVESFSRDCVDKPLYLNKVITDSTYKMFYRSCTTDLCNDSDGSQGSTNVDVNFGASPNMVIKGKNAATSSLARINGLLIGPMVLLLLTWHLLIYGRVV